MTNPNSKSKSRITIGFSLKPDFEEARILLQDTEIYPRQKLLVSIGGYETCFGISLDPKTIRLESKRAKNLSTKDCFNPAKYINMYKLKADTV